MPLPPLSLYIHIPWCVRKCPYCDFNSHAQQGELPEAAYVAALLADLQEDLQYVQGREIQSIFIGGGTPSLFSATAYKNLFAGLQAQLRFADDIEITLEANPGTLEYGRFQGYRQLGINRLSIGVQSFSAQHLHNLGRIHGGDEARAAIDCAQQSGFDNFNVDLMHGLNEQTPEQAADDLATAISAGAPHISWYQLTIEANTEFYKRPPILPVDSTLAAIQQRGLSLFEESGYQRYEVSAYARPGHRARHNLNYWRFGDYLGIGAGAHAKVSCSNGSILRYQKSRKPEDYLQRQGSRTSKHHAIASEDLPLEFMMNALRLRDGFSTEQFEQTTGLGWQTIQAAVESLQQQGLLERTAAGHHRATARGYELLDGILGEFLAT